MLPELARLKAMRVENILPLIFVSEEPRNRLRVMEFQKDINYHEKLSGALR